ncbi:MAG: folate family ECF transporter S component [Eubacteriales bacterium]|nr:folate family ECF transporter S component [Eubacteriales bacterium]
MRNTNTKRLVVCGLFTAIGVILSGPLTIPSFSLGVYSVNIGIGVLPVILISVLYGPLYGGIVGGLVDVLQVLLFPKGAFVPWFTLVAVLLGVIVGLFFRKGQACTFLRSLCAITVGRVITSVALNTALIVLLYEVPLGVILPARLINQLIEIPILSLLTWWLAPYLKKYGI